MNKTGIKRLRIVSIKRKISRATCSLHLEPRRWWSFGHQTGNIIKNKLFRMEDAL